MKNFVTKNWLLLSLGVCALIFLAALHWGYPVYKSNSEINVMPSVMSAQKDGLVVVNGKTYRSVTETTSLYSSEKQIDMIDWLDPVSNERQQITSDQFALLRSGQLGQPIHPYFDLYIKDSNASQKILDAYQNPKNLEVDYEIGEGITKLGLRISHAVQILDGSIITKNHFIPIGGHEYLFLESNPELINTEQHNEIINSLRLLIEEN